MASRIRGRKFSNLGLVFAFLSLVTLPIVFGPIAVILGVKGYFSGDEKRGMLAIVLGVVFAVISAILGAYLFSLGAVA
ncbi:MAG: hypothetical protein HY518_01280 [Candidatus Aenigmarchaeota archaeon]|nr:hypothetical protein [Candidatus Aenigmarchaeota archaeon]